MSFSKTATLLHEEYVAPVFLHQNVGLCWLVCTNVFYFHKGSKSNNVEGVAEATERHSIEFSPHPQLLKPSLTFSSKVSIYSNLKMQ